MRSQKFLKLNRSVQAVILALIVVLADQVFISESASNELLNPANTKCACRGDVLTYNCTVVGNGSTLWQGSALDCTIFLRHNRFDQSGGVDGACNNGDIIGKSLRVEDNCYTSQLNVTVSHTLNNKTIACILSSDDGLINIGNSTLKVIQAPFPPPQNVQLEDIRGGNLSFTWNSLDPNCKAINYYPAFNCGICPDVSTTTRTSCSYFQLSTDTRMCNFTVHGVRCVSQAENPASNSIMVILKLPDTPEVKVAPVYSNDSGKLTKLLAEINHQPVSYIIANGISGDVTHYKICLWSSSEIILCNSTISTSHCMSGLCEVSTDIEEYFCATTASINVTFSAGNILGLGPSLDPIRIDCSNQLVTIRYDLTSSTISCQFFDRSTETKSCYIQHGLCTEEIYQYTGSNITSSSVTLSLKLNISYSNHEYCYRVTASNSTHTVIVEGQIEFDSNATNGDPPLVAIIVPVLIAIICILLVLILTSVICYYNMRRKKGKFVVVTKQSSQGHSLPVTELETCVDEKPPQNTKIVDTPVDRTLIEPCTGASIGNQKSKSEPSANNVSQLNLKPIDQLNERFFIKFTVEEDCDLEGFFDSIMGITYKRGNTFYEFREKENISEEKQLIFMPNGKKEYYFPDVGKDVLYEKRLLGEEITVPKWIKDYKVLVQSTGLRAKYLPKASTLLYEESAPLPFHQLVCIATGQFELKKVNQIKITDCNRVFFELHDCGDAKCSDIIDVILLNQKTSLMYTGRFAFDMVQQHIDKISTIEAKLWRVFIFSECKVKSEKGRNSEALLQIEPYAELLQSDIHPGRSPFFRIDQRQFTIVKTEKSYHLKLFRKIHNLEEDHQIYLKLSDEKGLKDALILNVILIDKETNQFYTCRSWDASGIDLKQSRMVLYMIIDDDEYKLSAGASVLFREGRKLNLSKKMVPLYTKHFHECKYCDLQESQKAQSNKCNIFVKLDCCPKGVSVLDVILKDKETDEKLLSGPCARQMVDSHLLGIQQIDLKKWDVFVLSKKGVKVPEDSPVLCQDPECTDDEYHILTVENDVIKMSNFIENELEQKEFVNGRAFYEFTKEEDLLGYKEVIHVPNELIDRHVENLYTLKSDTTWFYNISGTPGLSVKPPIVPQTRVFLQSTSQGARCLKKGMVILYKADVTVNEHKAAEQTM